jgi:predicted Zn-dependent protease
MQAVWRSFGAGLVLDALVGGGSGAGQQAVLLAGSLSDLRFSREAEAEADVRGMALLRSAGLSSRGMAGFFGKLANPDSTKTARNAVELLNTHPDTVRRVARARAAARDGASAMTAAEWRAVQAVCNEPD